MKFENCTFDIEHRKNMTHEQFEKYLQNSEKIKAFLTEMTMQDNRGTSFPYYYCIRDFQPESVGEDCDWDYALYCEYFDRTDFRTYDEWHDYYAENGETELEIEESLSDLVKTYMKYVPVDIGMFLTESDAKESLDRYNYHYNAKAEVYLHSAKDAPKMVEFFEALFENFEVPLPCSKWEEPSYENQV